MHPHTRLADLFAPAPARRPVYEALARRMPVARMMGLTLGDGTEIASVRLGDGTAIEEIRTGDGTVLWTKDAIPDSGDLHSRFDFSEEDGSTPVGDLSGNGFDLTEGAYTGVSETINGIQAGEFDGTDDGVWYDGSFSDLRPFTLYAVAEHGDSANADTAHDNVVTFGNGSTHHFANRDTGTWGHFEGAWATGSTDLSNQLFAIIVEDTDDQVTLRENGAQTASASGGGGSATQLGVGSRNPQQDSQHFPGAIGEVLLYDTIHDSTTTGDVESYLGNKWGISLD